MAADPEPIVSEANAGLIDCRVSCGSFSRESIVPSTSPRPISVPTTTPAVTWPSSIMFASIRHPLSNPRQALLTSRIMVWAGNPMDACTPLAVAGSN